MVSVIRKNSNFHCYEPSCSSSEKMSMLCRVQDLRNHPIFVRTVGSLSCVVGLLCYALSSSFKSLFGEWNPTKIVLYIILSSIISVVVLFEDKSRVSVVSKLKPHVEFLVLMLTSLYSFFADQSMKGKPDTWSVVSSGAFALTSLCLSLQIEPGFDVGMFSFFLGCVTVQLMKIHLIFILVAAVVCYPLVVLGSYSEPPSENGDSIPEELLEILLDDGNIGQDTARQTSLRRRVTNVSRSPSPLPSTGLTQDDDKSFEKLPRVAADEQLLSDLQEQVAANEKFLSDLQEKRWQSQQHQEQPPPQRHEEQPPPPQCPPEQPPPPQWHDEQLPLQHEEQPPLQSHQEQPPSPQRQQERPWQPLQLLGEGPLPHEQEAQRQLRLRLRQAQRAQQLSLEERAPQKPPSRQRLKHKQRPPPPLPQQLRRRPV
ncbi:hypothetical protein QN277_016503 [Acacia crassicarpa]|uniref:Uncharacterized protein n=1 Tax=Acacia crassicarpa TaxID=499986 RepID=A0AAE1TC92_9FABA|nr:hypothetical protein QN277_016503 [Acacia crassicarpa]